MKRLANALCGLLIASWCAPAFADEAPDDAAAPPAEPMPKQLFDLTVEGGLGAIIDPGEFAGFGRARAGFMALIDTHPMASPWIVAAGFTYEISQLSALTVGVQTEIAHVGTGLWLQGGGVYDFIADGPGWLFAAGWSIVGLELQRRSFAIDRGAVTGLAAFGLFGKLRLPITLLAASP